MQHSSIPRNTRQNYPTIDVFVISGAETSTLKTVVNAASSEAAQTLSGSVYDVLSYGGVGCCPLLCDNGGLESHTAFTQWIS